MRITKTACEKEGHCNFCERSTLDNNGYGLIYPYTEVYQIEGFMMSSIKARVCHKCANEFADFINKHIIG